MKKELLSQDSMGIEIITIIDEENNMAISMPKSVYDAQQAGTLVADSEDN